VHCFDDPEFVHLIPVGFTQGSWENILGSRAWALAVLEHAIDDGLTGLVGLFGHRQKALFCATYLWCKLRI
jgi:hypothetical protein